MKVLVAGGAGYIGSHVAHCLRDAGHTPIIYDNFSTGFRRLVNGMETIEGDIADPRALRRALQNADAVMHFAARAYVHESVANPRGYYETNLLGALNLLNATLDAGIGQFIFSSTCAIYGIPATIPVSEETVRNPINPYGATKAAFENALASYSRAYGLRFIALRYFNAAGADEKGRTGELHEPETHLIPNVLRAAAGIEQSVKVCGDNYETPDGTCIRDYIHVSDLAMAHLSALELLDAGGQSDFINLGTGRGHSVAEVIACAEKITGINIRKEICACRAGDPPILVSRSERAYEKLGWRPRYGLPEMIRTAWDVVQPAA